MMEKLHRNDAKRKDDSSTVFTLRPSRPVS